MVKRPRARLLKARFPRLRQLRQEQLGWEIVDILSRLPGSKPSISSIYRLEQGEAIRMSSARRVFDVVNGALENKLDASRELEASWWGRVCAAFRGSAAERIGALFSLPAIPSLARPPLPFHAATIPVRCRSRSALRAAASG